MTDTWSMVPLGEVLTRSGERVEIRPDRRYRQVTVRLWGQGVVLRNEVSGTRISAKKRYVVRSKQFILSRIDARNGALGLVPDALDGAVVSNDFPSFYINRERLEPRFLAWMSKTRSFVDLCQMVSEGTTNRVRLQVDRFLATEVPLPPLDEQHRIVARIEELAALIEEARDLRAKACEGAQALMEAALNEVFSQLFTENTKRRPLSDPEVCRLVPGQHIMSRDYNVDCEGTPYITGPADFGAKSPRITKWTSTPKSLSERGDVLLTVKGAGVGKINFAPGFPLCIGRQVMALRPSTERLIAGYLYYFLMNNYDYFQDVARSTTVPGLKREHIWALEIPLPIVAEQHRIVTYLNNLQALLDELTALQDATQAELDAFLPSILDRAFKGEL